VISRGRPKRTIADRSPQTSDSRIRQIERLRHLLQDSRNVGGGWGYQPGKASRLEPTCWALLADTGRAPNLEVLLRWPQRDDGLLLARRGEHPARYATRFDVIDAFEKMRLPKT